MKAPPPSAQSISSAACAVALVVTVAATGACHVRTEAPPPPTPSAIAPPAAPAPPPAGKAQWVPRLAPSPTTDLSWSRMPTGDASPRGPMTNNYGTLATVALPGGKVGMVSARGRSIFDGPHAIWRDDGGSHALSMVLDIPTALGGGFVFWGDKGLYFSPAFDGALVPLAEGPVVSFDLGPGCIVLEEEGQERRLVSTKDGTPVAGAPARVVAMVGHPLGFAVGFAARDDDSMPAYFTDGHVWKVIPMTAARPNLVSRDGDGLFFRGSDEKTFGRLTRDGVFKKLALSREDALTREMGGLFRQPAPLGADTPVTSSLLDSSWVSSGRAPDEWVAILQGQVWATRLGARGVVKIGPHLEKADGCLLLPLDGAVKMVCTELGTKLEVFAVDLATGARTLERAITVTKGMAQAMGTLPGANPPALFVWATCEGVGGAGLCVRDPHGSWKTFESPRPDEKMFLFPGEVLFVESVAKDAWDQFGIRRAGESAPLHFAPGDALKMAEALGFAHIHSLEEATTIDSGALRTPTGIRFFYAPNPFHTPPPTTSFVADVPLTPGGHITTRAVPGVIAPAGWYALRLDQGKLYETNDGWDTWSEVAPPPDGPLANLDLAMCEERGCRLGAWARIGWDNPRRAAH